MHGASEGDGEWTWGGEDRNELKAAKGEKVRDRESGRKTEREIQNW